MAEEIIGELQVRQTQPDDVFDPGLTTLSGPTLDEARVGDVPILAGPTTIRLDGDGPSLAVGGSEPSRAPVVADVVNGAGRIRLRDRDGFMSVAIYGEEGDIVLSNADIAEEFDVAVGAAVPPGSVVVIDDRGCVRPASSSFDPRVVGVVAGAGHYRPGVVLDRQNPCNTSRVSVSILGKAVVRATTQGGPVVPGALLTSSSSPGAAMVVAPDQARPGTIVGKALSGLSPDGTLLALISLR